MGATHSNKSETIRNMLATGETVQHCAAFVGVSDGFVRSVASRAKNMASATVSATVETMQETGKPETSGIGVSKDKFEGSNEGPPAANVSSGGAVKKAWPLWLCLAMAMACSVPNMIWVAHQLKADINQAYMVTAAFTVAPFLLIYYNVGAWLKWVPYVPIGAEIFCNAAGFYGGMTGLAHSLYVDPTPFLHMVTTMTDSANEQTAFALAFFFAVCIALLAIVAVRELEKRNK